MAGESFRRGRWGWARSSEGYAVRLLGRNDLQYADELGEVRLFAEPLSKPWNRIVVDTSQIPDRPERSRDEVLARLKRAFDYKGWTLIETND